MYFCTTVKGQMQLQIFDPDKQITIHFICRYRDNQLGQPYKQQGSPAECLPSYISREPPRAATARPFPRLSLVCFQLF